MKGPLTVVYYTANYLETANPHFLAHTRAQLVRAADGMPIISVSQKPISFVSGVDHRNICVGDIGRSHLNIYRQLLIGAREATTPFVATAEDDILYSASHFRTHRPPPTRFAYDLNRWGINTWVKPPMFGYRARPVVNQLIAPTSLLIDSLEERFNKFKGVPDEQVPISFWGDPGRYEKQLGVTVREFECFAAPEPSIVFSHEHAFGFLNHGVRKSVGEFPRTELPGWGSAEEIMRLWTSGVKPHLNDLGLPSLMHWMTEPCGAVAPGDCTTDQAAQVDCKGCLRWFSDLRQKQQAHA